MLDHLTRARRTALLALPLCLLALSACGTGSSSTAAPPSPTAAPAAHTSSTTPPAPPASTTTTTATSSATTSTMTATTAPVSTCQPSQLHASAGGSGAAMQQYGQRILLTNTSSASCTLYGYPGVALLDSGGRAIETAVHHGPGYTFPDPGPSLVHLDPGASASFTFGGVDVSQPQGIPCPTAQAVNVIPPNDETALTVEVRAAACPGGVLDVSAVAPGSG